MGISNTSSSLRSGVCTSTTRPTTPYEGQVIYETDTDRLYVFEGTSWLPIPIVTANGTATVMTVTANGRQGQLPHAIAAGTISASTYSAYQNTYYGSSAAITFPAGRFSQTPMVVANVSSGGYGWASCNSVTNTGISYMWLIADSNGTTRTINWIAVQMVSISGAG